MKKYFDKFVLALTKLIGHLETVALVWLAMIVVLCIIVYMPIFHPVKSWYFVKLMAYNLKN